MTLTIDDKNKIFYKKIGWFADFFKRDYSTIEKIFKYLNINPSIKDLYPISAVNDIKKFLEQNQNTRSFFVKYTQKNSKQKIIDNIRSDDNKKVLSDLIEELDIDYWRVICFLHQNNISLKKIQNVSYLDKDDYIFVRDNLLKLKDNFKIRSFPQKEIFEFIKSIYPGKIFQNYRKLLDGAKEIDIYIPDKHIGIEFNGTYWHSTLTNIDRDYHFKKSIECQNKGVRLIHIYEYEWLNLNTREKIKSMLRIALGNVPSRIYAKNCIVKQISNTEAKPFNDKNHLQGHRNAQVTYGLFYNNELVQLMSFSKIKYNRNLKDDNSWEIIRGCPASNNIVVGGISKLFKYFLKIYQPHSVFSYCDFNKFDGNGYDKLGWTLVGYTGPDMSWVLPNMIVVKRNPSKHKQLKEISIGNIYGSGSKKYLWEDKNYVCNK